MLLGKSLGLVELGLKGLGCAALGLRLGRMDEAARCHCGKGESLDVWMRPRA